LIGQSGAVYKITDEPNINFRALKNIRVKLTYLQTSKVVISIEPLEQFDTVHSFQNIREEEDKSNFFMNRILMSFENQIIKLPIITAITNDNIMNRVAADVYCLNIVQYEKNDERDALFIKELNEQIRALAEEKTADEFSKQEEIKGIVERLVNNFYSNADIDRVEMAIESAK
jgi:hypothetical protein